MPYGPEEFAELYYKKFPRIAPVSAALLKHPNWGFTVEELNKELGLEIDDTEVEGTRRVLRNIKDTIEIISSKNPRGPPTKIYKPGKLLEAYRHPIVSTVFGKGREEFYDYHVDCVIVDARQDEARVHALEERAKKGEQSAFDELIQVLSSDASKYARQDAAISLGCLGDARAIEPLTKAMLNDEYSDVRSTAVRQLEPFGYCQEFAVALKDDDRGVRQAVAATLGKLGDTRAIGPLVLALRDSDIFTQTAAAIALGEIGDPKAIDALIPMVNHDNESARSAAATALGNIDDPRAISLLEEMCKDLSGNVQAVAKKSLGIPLRPSTYTDTMKKCDDEEEYLALKNVHASIGQLIIHQKKGDMFCFGAALRGHHGFPQLLRQLENGNYIKKR